MEKFEISRSTKKKNKDFLLFTIPVCHSFITWGALSLADLSITSLTTKLGLFVIQNISITNVSACLLQIKQGEGETQITSTHFSISQVFCCPGISLAFWLFPLFSSPFKQCYFPVPFSLSSLSREILPYTWHHSLLYTCSCLSSSVQSSLTLHFIFLCLLVTST